MRHTVTILLATAVAIGPLPACGEAGSAEKGSSGSEEVGRPSRLAFFMSLIVPGLGELYYGAYKRGVAFLAAEAGVWGTYAYCRRRGLHIERDFRAFADRRWSQDRYQAWDANTPKDFYIRTERLPSKQEDTQQYYELIGKYDQFVFGWDDGKDPQGHVGTDIPYTVHPSMVISANRLNYEIQRNRSNRYWKRGTRLLGVVVVNHILSAIDASIHARGHKAQLWIAADETDDVPSGFIPTIRINVTL